MQAGSRLWEIQIDARQSAPEYSGRVILPRYVPPYDSKEKHYFGFNYCGPGTNVRRRMRNKVQPMDALDALCLEHDIVTEPRGPYTSRGKPALLRAADRKLRDSIISQELHLPGKGYKKWDIAAAVVTAMNYLLWTGARGRK